MAVQGLSITYGDNYRENFADFAGQNLKDKTPCLDSNIYVRPYYRVWKLESGKVLKVTEKSFSDYLELYDSLSEYYASKNAYYRMFPDPETGKRTR